MRRFRYFGVYIGLLFAAALPCCGPVQASSAIAEGEKALELARLADAEKLASYPYYRAEAYLHIAKTKEGFAEYEIAAEYAKEALKAAENSLVICRKRAALKKAQEERNRGGGK
ncbi:MAG: hypothetical protein HUU55_20195 [Myxococcales bacterium]|nr:hypothetical protein [Myxococcales bacterium]